jgi:hypothetical protein
LILIPSLMFLVLLMLISLQFFKLFKQKLKFS